MPELLFARHRTLPLQLMENDAQAHEQFCRANFLGKHDILPPARAYSFDHVDPRTRGVVMALNGQSDAERRTLAGLVEATGEELHALAAFAARYWSRENLQKMAGFVGAGATAATARLDAFEKAVVNYQNAMLNLRRLMTSQGARPAFGAKRLEAENAVRRAFQVLEERFAKELKHFSHEAQRARNTGTAFSNADRGILLAKRRPRSPKTDPRIKVADHLQASRLASFSKLINHLGYAAVAADGVLRTMHVAEVRDKGGDWLKESSRELAGFGTGGALGLIAGKATISGGMAIASYTGLAMAGPVGWVVLGTIIAAGLYAGYKAGQGGDWIGKNFADWLWNL